MELRIERTNATIFNVEGFPTANDSAKTANDSVKAAKDRFNRIVDKIVDEGFIEAALERVCRDVNWASEDGRKTTRSTGYGNTSSPLRAAHREDIEAKKYLLEQHIIPFLKKQGYKCGEVEIERLANRSYYLSYDILW